jgi:thiosulfate/3-mercaptopyruvate sulfurtransferase
VVDARAPERFRGEQEPIDPVAGHIPGAINLPLADNLGADGRFLDPVALGARFRQAIGDRAPERIVHSCGSGVNACHNLLAMEVAGLQGSRLYAGSWSEWIRSPERPVAVGAG